MNHLAIVFTRSGMELDAPLIRVEIHLSKGIPHLNIVGLPETAVKESKERVRSAIINSGFIFPLKRITINLAPASLPKRDGGRFDLAIAIGILVASEQIKIPNLEQYEFSGELALDGSLHSKIGSLSIALATKKAKRTLIFPKNGSSEIAIISDLNAFVANNLKEVCLHFSAENYSLNKLSIIPLQIHQTNEDLKEVCGQTFAKRALEIAATGGHNLLLWGPPGVGKSMLARRLPTILPPLTISEILEIAQIYSLTGISYNNTGEPPFRFPHHSASTKALVGGGSPPKPGEISLAHHGVLFLDELLEFPRSVLDALREPLETQQISIARVEHHVNFPANFQLIVAMNPCPCGYWGSDNHECTCSCEQIKRYQSRLSGPFLDRIDLWVHLKAPSVTGLKIFTQQNEESSLTIKNRVLKARELAKNRSGTTNALLNKEKLWESSKLTPQISEKFEQLTASLNLSSRAYCRLIKVARTIADLANDEKVTLDHLLEALSYRQPFSNDI